MITREEGINTSTTFKYSKLSAPDVVQAIPAEMPFWPSEETLVLSVDFREQRHLRF